MAQDPYKLLGVARGASDADIKRAYRKLAKELHPDLNPNRKDIEKKFKEVSAAYALLSDKDKRARFDRGELDAEGNERSPFSGSRSYRQPHGGMGGDPFGFGGGGFSTEDIFAQFFGDKKPPRPPRPKGADVNYTLKVSFEEACLGAEKRLALSSGKTIDVKIPVGSEDGHKLRLKGQGQEGVGGAGDALIEIKVMPHKQFTREGKDIYLDVPVALHEAVLGESITVPTLSGSVSVKLRPHASGGTTMRLKGKGVPSPHGGAGDIFVRLKITLPTDPAAQEALSKLVNKWAQKYKYMPRDK
jgi:DnaJ-class molecular chaperone